MTRQRYIVEKKCNTYHNLSLKFSEEGKPEVFSKKRELFRTKKSTTKIGSESNRIIKRVLNGIETLRSCFIKMSDNEQEMTKSRYS